MRLLETEVKELKDLLEQKDEEIELHSKIQPDPKLYERPSVSGSRPAGSEVNPVAEKPKPLEDVFRIQQSSYRLSGDHQDSFFMGASSAISFVGGC